MRIQKILSRHRRDFVAIYKCEHCGFEKEGSGYDDNYFHSNVIPQMKCENCNQTAKENYQPRTTKYLSSQVV